MYQQQPVNAQELPAGNNAAVPGDDLYEYVDGLMQGDFSPLCDSDSPPWLEPGVIKQLTPDFYGLTLKDSVQQLAVADLPSVHICQAGSGPLTVAWKEDGMFFARELLRSEAKHLQQLCDTYFARRQVASRDAAQLAPGVHKCDAAAEDFTN